MLMVLISSMPFIYLYVIFWRLMLNDFKPLFAGFCMIQLVKLLQEANV